LIQLSSEADPRSTFHLTFRESALIAHANDAKDYFRVADDPELPTLPRDVFIYHALAGMS